MSDPAPREVGKILLRAAEMLEGGWCKGSYASNESGSMQLLLAQPGVDSFCLTGAIMKAVAEHDGDTRNSSFLMLHPLTVAAYDALHTVIPIGDPLTNWNDTVCTSGAMAAAKLREAADALDR